MRRAAALVLAVSIAGCAAEPADSGAADDETDDGVILSTQGAASAGLTIAPGEVAVVIGEPRPTCDEPVPDVRKPFSISAVIVLPANTQRQGAKAELGPRGVGPTLEDGGAAAFSTVEPLGAGKIAVLSWSTEGATIELSAAPPFPRSVKRPYHAVDVNDRYRLAFCR